MFLIAPPRRRGARRRMLEAAAFRLKRMLGYQIQWQLLAKEQQPGWLVFVVVGGWGWGGVLAGAAGGDAGDEAMEVATDDPLMLLS